MAEVAASGADVRVAPRPHRRARRTVPAVPLRQLHQDARQRAPAAWRAAISPRPLRGLPRVARHQKASTPRTRYRRRARDATKGVPRPTRERARPRAHRGNADVPVCTDCHRAHDVGGPRNDRLGAARARDVRRCHSNER
jgi:hypothetical protein